MGRRSGTPVLYLSIPLAALLLLLPLSGCVYLRLLQIKKQLLEFDRNFSLSGRSSLVIEFKNPVLYAKDARFLIGADPLSRTPGDEETDTAQVPRPGTVSHRGVEDGWGKPSSSREPWANVPERNASTDGGPEQ